MIKSKLYFLLLFFVIVINNAISQKLERRSYVIITVEDSFSRGFEGIFNYYWIIESDSIKVFNSLFYPLLFDFSKSNFENCCKGIDIDPFSLTKADSVYYIGNEYYKEAKTLEKIIRSKRKKVQQITKNWVLRKGKELITFYITPINGIFCSSNFSKTGQWRTGYSGR